MPEADDPKTGSTESRHGDGFYGRWSRRKRLQRAGDAVSETPPAAAAPPAPLAAAAKPAEPAAADDGAVERVLTDADMPDLDAMAADADFSPFLSPGVSEGLRRRALRKLFAGAAFNVTDGLDDYDDDFTSFAPLGDIVTSDMRHRMEREAEEARARAEAEAKEQARAGAPEEPDAEAGEAAPAHGRPAEDEIGRAPEHAAPEVATARGDEHAGEDTRVGATAPAPGVAGGTAAGEAAGRDAAAAQRVPELARHAAAGGDGDAPPEEDPAPAAGPHTGRDARDDG